MKPFESRKIVHFKSMPGGSASFGGFDTELAWKDFEEDMRRIPAMWYASGALSERALSLVCWHMRA